MAIAGCSGVAEERLQYDRTGPETVGSRAAASWLWRYPHPQGNELYAVQMLSRSVAISGGDAGAVARTIDGGTTWTAHWTGSVRPLRAIFYQDAVHGVAVGDSGAIYQTGDGGGTWTARCCEPPTEVPRGLPRRVGRGALCAPSRARRMGG